MAVSVFPAVSGGLQPNEQVFLSSGTWTKPSGVKSVELIMAGAGGSGGAFTNSYGGGGGYFRGHVDVSTVNSVAVTVGAGVTNSAGGSSFFGNIVACSGGGTNAGNHLGGASGAWYYPTVSGNGFIETNTTLRATSNFFSAANQLDQSGSGAMLSNGTYLVNVGTSGQARKSLDGISWSNTFNFGSGTNFASMQTRLAWGNNLWIAVSHTQSNYYTSADGENWTSRSVPAALGAGRAISFANGRFFMAGTTDGILHYSTDGINWSACTVNGISTSKAGRVAFGLGYWAMICSGSDASGRVFTSGDGITFSQSASGLTAPNEYSDIFFQNGFFFAQMGTTTARWTSNPSSYSYIQAAATDHLTVGGGFLFQTSGANVTARYSTDNGANWITFQNSAYVRAVFHKTTIFVYRIQSGSPDYQTLSGFAGARPFAQSGGSSTQPTFGAGAGGPGGYWGTTAYGATLNNSIDGYCGGGSIVQTSGSSGNFGWGVGPNQVGRDGIVIVRWWA